MYNAFTVDVEDYFMVAAFSDIVSFEDWGKYECRVERSTEEVLKTLEEFKVKGTFFIVGWIAEKMPSLVKKIASAGHEIGCHSYSHRCIFEMTRAEFREDLRRSKAVLEDVSGTAVKGYRAPSYSIVKGTLWALDELVEQGFEYDSSIFPIVHDRYGITGASRFPHIIRTGSGSIIEFPPSTVRLLGQNIPVAGGGYLRFFPLSITKGAFRKINRKEGQMVMLYMHPWEVDTGQPRINGSAKAKLRHYLNLSTTIIKLRGLLGEFRFRPVRELLTPSLVKGLSEVNYGVTTA